MHKCRHLQAAVNAGAFDIHVVGNTLFKNHLLSIGIGIVKTDFGIIGIPGRHGDTGIIGFLSFVFGKLGNFLIFPLTKILK